MPVYRIANGAARGYRNIQQLTVKAVAIIFLVGIADDVNSQAFCHIDRRQQ